MFVKFPGYESFPFSFIKVKGISLMKQFFKNKLFILGNFIDINCYVYDKGN